MTSQPVPIRIAIVEDQREVREGLSLLIGHTPGYLSRGAFGSVEEALGHMKTACPDVVLVDIGLPCMSGIEGIRVMKSLCPQAQFLVLTVYDDDRRIFEAMCAGACGYLLKKTPPPRILEAMREVHSGGAPMSPEVARRVIALFRQVRPPEKAEYTLTAQETRVLRLLGEGHRYKTAAADLGITINTLSFHVRSIYDKLQVHSKSEAVAKALRDGILRVGCGSRPQNGWPAGVAGNRACMRPFRPPLRYAANFSGFVVQWRMHTKPEVGADRSVGAADTGVRATSEATV